MFSTFFFDQDGVLLDSMPNHARAWHDTFAQYGIPFSERACYLNEGRTGRDMITRHAEMAGIHFTPDEVVSVYLDKSRRFHDLGGGRPMRDIDLVLATLRNQGASVWVVTGGGQPDLYERLEEYFPGVFPRTQVITAHDVVHGKPHPEPYLRAWQGAGVDKSQCCVVENAPLGIRAAKAAGLFTVGVNTGKLTREDLIQAGADIVFDNMAQLNTWLQHS